MHKKEIQNISRIKETYLLTIIEFTPVLQAKMKIKLLSEETDNEWFTSTPKQNKPIQLFVDSKKLIIQIYDRSVKNNWKIVGRGQLQEKKKNAKINSLKDKEVAYEVLYMLGKEEDSDFNSKSNIFQGMDEPSHIQEAEKEESIREKLKTLDDSLSQHLRENSFERVLFTQIIDDSTSYIASLQNEKEQKSISEIKEEPISEEQSKVQDISTKKLNNGEKIEENILKLKSLSLQTELVPQQIIISILDKYKQEQLFKLNNLHTKIWNKQLIFPFSESNSLLIKYFYQTKEYTCFFGKQQMKKGTSTIYDFDGNPQGYISLQYIISKDINIQTNQILNSQAENIDQIREEKVESIKPVSEKLQNIEIKLQNKPEPKKEQESIVKIDVESSIESYKKEYLRSMKRRPHLKKFTEVDIKINPQQRSYMNFKEQNSFTELKRMKTDPYPQYMNDFKLNLHQVESQESEEFDKDKQSQNIHELNVFSVQNFKKSTKFFREKEVLKTKRRDQINFKIISLSLKLDSPSFEGKYLQVMIVGKKPYITSTSKQTMFHSWMGTSYFFEKVSLFSSLLIKVYSTNGQISQMNGECKINLMELPWQNGNLLKQYEDYVRQKNQEVLGKVHFVYEFSDFKRNNMLSTISKSTKVQKKFDTISSKDNNKRVLRKRNNTQISNSLVKKQKVIFRPYKKVFQSDDDREFFQKRKNNKKTKNV